MKFEKEFEQIKQSLEQNDIDALVRNINTLYYSNSDFSVLSENEKNEVRSELIKLVPEVVNGIVDLRLFLLRAELYYKIDDLDNAIKYYSKALALEPENSEILSDLGKVYFYLGNYDESKKSLLKSIDINPKNFWGWYYLANLYYEVENYIEAIASYKRAIDIDQTFYLTYRRLGDSYFKIKNYYEALKSYKTAMSINGYNRFLFMSLGDTAKELKDYASAREYYQQILSLESGNHGTEDYVKQKLLLVEKLLQDSNLPLISEIVNKIKTTLEVENPLITHYTSLSVVNCLIFKNSKFRLSEATYLNDTSEGNRLCDLLGFNENDGCEKDNLTQVFITKPFIGSFVHSKLDNELTLWRMYGKENKEEAKGCSITLSKNNFIDNSLELCRTDDDNEKSSISKIIKEQFKFYQVAYIDKNGKIFFIHDKDKEQLLNEQISDLKEAIKKIRKQITIDIKEKIAEVTYLFKTSEYRHEDEIRLVVSKTGFGIEPIVDTAFQPPRVYIELFDINKSVKKIVIGPKVDKAEEWAAALHYHFAKNNRPVEIGVSTLPFK